MPYRQVKRDFKAGDLILLCAYSHEDYEEGPLLRVIRDFSMPEVIGGLNAAALQEPLTDQRETIWPSALVDAGVAEVVEYDLVSVGDHGNPFRPVICKHPNPPVDADMGTMGVWKICPDCRLKIEDEG